MSCLNNRPIAASMNVYSSAVSYILSYLPDLPPCPAPMFVFSKSRLSSVFNVRSLATYLAGSQYVTLGSFNPPVTSIGG